MKPTIFAITLVAALSGCASAPVDTGPGLRVPASLRAPCADLDTVPAGDGKTLLPWAVSTVKLYKICQSRQRSLSDALQK